MMMSGWLLDLRPWEAIAVISAIWATIGIASGFGAQLLGSGFLAHDTWVTRPRGFEGRGRMYERRLRISRWKDRLPEVGTALGGPRSKRTLGGAESGRLVGYQAETRRAEYVHWTNIGAGPAFVLVLPPLGALAMTGFATMVHLPFIMVQRYNRLRIGRVLERRTRQGSGRLL